LPRSIPIFLIDVEGWKKLQQPEEIFHSSLKQHNEKTRRLQRLGHNSFDLENFMQKSTSLRNSFFQQPEEIFRIFLPLSTTNMKEEP
jgi:hypothetical protein